MVEAKPSAPAIFYEEATNKPFTMLYGWPDHQRVRCFSTFDPNYFARFRSLRLKVLLGPQVNDSPRDYNALQAAMRPFQAALIIENSANPLPSSVSWIPWQHFRKQTEKASLVQKLALAQRADLEFSQVESEPADGEEEDNIWFWYNYGERTQGHFFLGANGEEDSDMTEEPNSDGYSENSESDSEDPVLDRKLT
ncbi:hypothetical protein EG328_001185 [Venturia inaequalis]|uniref:Uncharacterized protein n=1 Tax=Venturia inaequalis TaxID=5025 RepID=A0A8H3UYH6_VENIN|nr:hypothetical protein EG328_001185 [Venturia inaequalis]